MKRQLDDYYAKFYSKLFDRGALLARNNFEEARNIAAWKRRFMRLWKDIIVKDARYPGDDHSAFRQGDVFKAEIVLDLGELTMDEVGIEVLFGKRNNGNVEKLYNVIPMQSEPQGDHVVKYHCEVPITTAGAFDFSFRMFPKHPLLPHRQDFCLVRFI